MFSPLLQGDLPRVLPSALHQTAALCASWRRVLGLFCAFLRYTLLSYPLPCGLSRIFIANFPRLEHTGFGGGDGRPSVPTLRFYEGAFEQWADGWGHPPLRKYRKLSGERRRGRSQTGPPITNLVRYSTAGASPRPTKDGRSKEWEEAFQSGRPCANPAILRGRI